MRKFNNVTPRGSFNMGMFSEIAASHEAKSLAKVLHKAIEMESDEVILFCKKNIYPLYLAAIGEAFEKVDETLKEMYED